MEPETTEQFLARVTPIVEAVTFTDWLLLFQPELKVISADRGACLTLKMTVPKVRAETSGLYEAHTEDIPWFKSGDLEAHWQTYVDPCYSAFCIREEIEKGIRECLMMMAEKCYSITMPEPST